MRRQTLGVALIALGLAGLLGTALAFAARSGGHGSGLRRPFSGVRGGPTCNAPALPGQFTELDVR